jgi:hypothetical protein
MPLIYIIVMIITTTTIRMVALVISFIWNHAKGPAFLGLRRVSCILFSNVNMTWNIVKFQTAVLNSVFKLPSGMLMIYASYNRLSNNR